MWDHPDRSEAIFRAQLPAASEDPTRQAEILTQIARAQGLQGHRPEALASLGQAEALLPQALPRARVRYLLESGRIQRDTGQADRALASFTAAYTGAVDAKEELLALDAVHMLAVADPERAVAWTQQGIALIETGTDPRGKGFLGPLYHNLAEHLHAAGDFEQALAWHRKDLAWRIATHRPASEQRIASWSIARELRCTHHGDQALELQRALLDEATRSQPVDPWEVGTIHEELAECLLAAGRTGEAGNEATTAMQTLQPLLDAADADDQAHRQRLDDLVKRSHPR